MWALVMGPAFLVLGVLWLAENRAAAAKSLPLRDALRAAIGLLALFALAWLILGNVWCARRPIPARRPLPSPRLPSPYHSPPSRTGPSRPVFNRRGLCRVNLGVLRRQWPWASAP